jgi:hypothetical protein
VFKAAARRSKFKVQGVCGAFKAASRRSRFQVQGACGAFKAASRRSKFRTTAGNGGVRFGQANDGGFGKFRMGFRRLVAMNMDSCFRRNDEKRAGPRIGAGYGQARNDGLGPDESGFL